MKWLYSLGLALLLFNCGQKTDETAAIKTLLEKESVTWQSGDIKAHADCWHIQQNFRIYKRPPIF